jgi:hypothetical protein
MTELIRISLDGGEGSLLVERTAADGPRGPVRAGAGDAAVVVTRASESLRSALVPIRDAASVVLSELRKAGPDEVQVEFGVTLTCEAGAFVAKAGTECHLAVTLTWNRAGDGAS